MNIPLTVEDQRTAVDMTVTETAVYVAAGINEVISIGGVSPYSGEYTVAPSAEEQRLATANTRLERDIVIEAIPQNYGLITWNGSILTVS